MGNGVHDELIRKQDALDALMAERKHLLAKGQKGAEHVLTHHGYNVIDELQPVQSDVPVINVGDMISRQAAIDALNVLCQEHRYKIPGKRETYSQYNEAWQDALDRAEGAIFNLPPVQPFYNITMNDVLKYIDDMPEDVWQEFTACLECRGWELQRRTAKWCGSEFA